MTYYVLQNYKLVPASFEEYVKQIQAEEHILEYTTVADPNGPFVVTYLASEDDMGEEHEGKIIVFQTDLVGLTMDNSSAYSSTVGEAKANHWSIVHRARDAMETS